MPIPSVGPSPRPATRRSLTLLESGRSLSGAHALQTVLGMLLYGASLSAVVVVSARQVAEALADAERSALYLAPEPKPVARTPEERLQYVGMISAPVQAPATETAPDGDAGAAVTVPGMAEHAVPSDEEVYEEFVLSEIDVDSAVIPDPASGGPEYPVDLLALEVEGVVLARFIVDSLGRVSPESFVSLQSTHPAFTRAVNDALTRMKFRPAYVGDKRVPQLVVQSFAFRIEKAAVDTLATRLVGSPG